jgi:hypothetical protein
MPFFEYVLVALLGSAGAAVPAVTPGDASMRTLTADIVTQPSGGTEGLLGGSADKSRKHYRRGTGNRKHYHRRHRHGLNPQPLPPKPKPPLKKV